METIEEIESVWKKNQEIESIVLADKVIRATLRWQRRPGGRYYLEAAVLVLETNQLLRLTGFKGKLNRSFALLYRNLPIRRYTWHQKDKNPDGQHIYGPHKHVWDEIYGEHLKYVPKGVPTGDINQELESFLKEVNIRRAGAYEPFLL